MSRKRVKPFPITRDIPHHTFVVYVLFCFVLFFIGAIAVSGTGPPHYRGFRSYSGTPHSVGLLWTSDQPDAETTAWQHTTFTRDVHPCLWLDSNTRSKEASGRKPTL
jgi:hypothetical protein